MKIQKQFCSLIIFLLISSIGYCQFISSEYSYDELGNRTTRTIFFFAVSTIQQDSTGFNIQENVMVENLEKSMSSDSYIEDTDEEERIEEKMTEVVEIINEDISINIYPNPVENILHLKINGVVNSEKMIYEIFDINGKLLERNFICSLTSEINLYKSPPGVYLVRLHINNDYREYKIIKK
ncbi:T9SS type A sorting domain-containing protein [Bacteroidales bacterium OttesenSCG-928-I21]|nr:T9SS type A sorting domain-containing protein [Bacteroidales bacterium OttesenSCG-928-I21]